MKISDMEASLKERTVAELNTIIRAVNLLPCVFVREAGLSVVKIMAGNIIKSRRTDKAFIISTSPALTDAMRKRCRREGIVLRISGNPLGLLFVRIVRGNDTTFEAVLNDLGIDYNDKE